jgi:RNA polymerase sigma-70 factor (ECF subfamily)
MAATVGEPDGLLERLKRGDREALAALFAEHHERLWRAVSFRMDRRLAGRIDADDVLQEAYLAAAQRLDRYVADPSWSAFVWLRMIVMQTLTDLHRYHLGAQMRDAGRETNLRSGPARGCPAVHAWQNPQTTSVSLAALLVGQVTSPSQAAARAEMFDQVERAIAAMDPLDQEVLALRHFEELSNSEVAEVLGIGQKAASIRYVRALKRLRAVLSQVPGFFEGRHDEVV